uniref:Putative E3 ubiquitin-protein ligase SH3RF2 n=1 Tax=Sus scrofa TaxID=9823 RepID=A0A480GDZ3_PIG
MAARIMTPRREGGRVATSGQAPKDGRSCSKMWRSEKPCQHSHHCDPLAGPPFGRPRNSAQNTEMGGCMLPTGKDSGWGELPLLGLAAPVTVFGRPPNLSPSQGRDPRPHLSFPGGKTGRTRTQARVPKEWQDALRGGRLYLNAHHLFGVWEEPPVDHLLGNTVCVAEAVGTGVVVLPKADFLRRSVCCPEWQPLR